METFSLLLNVIQDFSVALQNIIDCIMQMLAALHSPKVCKNFPEIKPILTDCNEQISLIMETLFLSCRMLF